HRLSDKLLKSSAASFFAAARGVHITLSRCRVNPFFRIFLFNRTGCLCEVIHIRRVDGGAL
ncbi:hypothetical protein, partial [Klebsiella quasipneumoniae]